MTELHTYPWHYLNFKYKDYEGKERMQMIQVRLKSYPTLLDLELPTERSKLPLEVALFSIASARSLHGGFYNEYWLEDAPLLYPQYFDIQKIYEMKVDPQTLRDLIKHKNNSSLPDDLRQTLQALDNQFPLVDWKLHIYNSTSAV